MFPSPFDDSLTFTNNPPSSPNSDHHHHHHQNPPPPFLFNLPSPFFDEDTLPLNQIFFQTTHLMTPTNHHPNNDDPPTKDQPAKSSSNEPDLDQPVPGIVRRRSLGVVPRRRTGKKDRHSKICTAQGIRDRRMRLSLQVARKFFDLQDMLGYDKASKTIEWLFTKSKKAIKELCKGCSPNKGSDAKTEYFLNNDEKMGPDPQGCVAATPLAVSDPNSDTKDDQKPNKTTAARQSRDKARERARSRAKEKRIVKQYEESSGFNKSNPNLQKLGFSNIQFEDHQSNKAVSPYSPTVFTSQEFSDLGTIEKFLGNSSSSISSSCPISDYLCSSTSSGYIDPNCNNLMGFSGNNWDLLNNDRMNSIQDVFTNQVQLADNPNSIYLATANFP